MSKETGLSQFAGKKLKNLYLTAAHANRYNKTNRNRGGFERVLEIHGGV